MHFCGIDICKRTMFLNIRDKNKIYPLHLPETLYYIYKIVMQGVHLCKTCGMHVDTIILTITLKNIEIISKKCVVI